MPGKEGIGESKRALQTSLVRGWQPEAPSLCSTVRKERGKSSGNAYLARYEDQPAGDAEKSDRPVVGPIGMLSVFTRTGRAEMHPGDSSSW